MFIIFKILEVLYGWQEKNILHLVIKWWQIMTICWMKMVDTVFFYRTMKYQKSYELLHRKTAYLLFSAIFRTIVFIIRVAVLFFTGANHHFNGDDKPIDNFHKSHETKSSEKSQCSTCKIPQFVTQFGKIQILSENSILVKK